MADLPLSEQTDKPLKKQFEKDPITGQIKVTEENAGPLTVHFLSQIYARLGYLIKIIEEKTSG